MRNNHHVDQRTVRSALALAAAAPSIRNSQPWRWTVDLRSVHLYESPRRRLPAAQTRDLLVSCGVALHHLRVALAASGLASTIHRMPKPDAPGHLASLDIHPSRAGAVDLTLAVAILRRRSDRRRFADKEVPDGFVAELAASAAAQGASLRPVTAAGSRARLVEAIHAAHENPVDQPADGQPDSTVLMVLSTASDTPLARLRAGEALSVALLSATALGLATCALSLPLENGTSRQALANGAFGGAAAPQLALRVGWAPGGPPIPPTPRRPLDSMITWLPGR